MKGKSIITINGRSYDAVTGFPVEHEAAPAHHRPTSNTKHHHRPAQQHPAPAHRPYRAFSDIAPRPIGHRPAMTRVATAAHVPAQAARSVHEQPQKTKTLYRTALQRPAPAIPNVSNLKNHQKTRSPLITKFAPQIPTGLQPVAEEVPEVQEQETPTPPTVHPTVAKALKRHAPAPNTVEKTESPHTLKERLIKQRLAEVDTKAAPAKREPRRAGQPRLATVFTSALALLLLGGYLTYINLPNLSMRVAATQAGVAAKFPNYQPDGYRFDGPISYAPGEVTINFKSTTNDSRFSIKQKASNWDSQAVLDNYVTKQSSTYLTYQERGLTIYAFNNKAAWVSGGLLYTIEGDASLSSEQVLRMATNI